MGRKAVADLIVRKITRGGNKGKEEEGKEFGEKEKEMTELARKLMEGRGVVDIPGVHRSHVESIVRFPPRRREW